MTKNEDPIILGPPSKTTVYWDDILMAIGFIIINLLLITAWFPTMSNTAKAIFRGMVGWRRRDRAVPSLIGLLDRCAKKGIYPLLPDEMPVGLSVLLYFADERERMMRTEQRKVKKRVPKDRLRSLQMAPTSKKSERSDVKAKDGPTPGQSHAANEWKQSEIMRYEQKLRDEMETAARHAQRNGWNHWVGKRLDRSRANRFVLNQVEKEQLKQRRLGKPQRTLHPTKDE